VKIAPFESWNYHILPHLFVHVIVELFLRNAFFSFRTAFFQFISTSKRLFTTRTSLATTFKAPGTPLLGEHPDTAAFAPYKGRRTYGS
jgi:hypothetical protein